MLPRSVFAGIRLALLAAAPGALAFGCDRAASPARDEAEPTAPPSERARVLGPFLDEYWRLPVPPQGPAPAGFSEAETALDPQFCGACHPKQHREWLTSLHSGAFSPGFAGQLVEGELAAPAEVRNCQTCHAPLAEQQPWSAALAPNTEFDAALRRHGIVCASCHVRAQRHFGPPRRAEYPEISSSLPHGGFEARPEFQQRSPSGERALKPPPVARARVATCPIARTCGGASTTRRWFDRPWRSTWYRSTWTATW
jgi:hypothetical protein